MKDYGREGKIKVGECCLKPCPRGLVAASASSHQLVVGTDTTGQILLMGSSGIEHSSDPFWIIMVASTTESREVAPAGVCTFECRWK